MKVAHLTHHKNTKRDYKFNSFFLQGGLLKWHALISLMAIYVKHPDKIENLCGQILPLGTNWRPTVILSNLRVKF